MSDLQYRDSSFRRTSLALGAKQRIFSENVNRGVDRTHDQTRQLLHPGQHGDLESIVSMYKGLFAGGETDQHRQTVRDRADTIWNRAHDELYNKYITNEQQIADEERLRLENKLDEETLTWHKIAGSTRNCFVAKMRSHTLDENTVKITSLLTQLRRDAIDKETAALEHSQQLAYNAYIEGDNADFSKYISALGILKGTWDKLDFTDNVDEDIDRSISEFVFTEQWVRSAGSIAAADGVYNGLADSYVGGSITGP